MSVGENGFGENAEMSASSADDTGNFDLPPSGQASSSNSGFDLPPGQGGDGSYEVGASIESSVSAQLLECKKQIEQKLVEAASSNAMSIARMRNVDSAGVQGVGISASSSIPGGEASLIVYVESSADVEQVRREIVDIMGVRAASSDSLPVEVEVTGPITAYTTNQSKFRPAPGGASGGHFQITAGTIGGWARGRGDDRRRRLLMLSNNHVLANSNAGKFGDPIIQPGRLDGGLNPADQIAILERFVPINFAAGSTNFVDCATGWCWPDRVRRDHVHHSGSTTAKFFRIGNAPIEPVANMLVGKTGRTTDLTQGTVRATGVTVNVDFGSAGVATFIDQFSVRSTTSGTFSAPGDSGSIVWAVRQGLPPVGLLFAGGGGTTFCNRITRVYAALQIDPFELPLI